MPSDSEAARLFADSHLSRKSLDSFTVGAIFELGALNITVDYFRTDVEDRIFLSNEIKLVDEVNNATGQAYMTGDTKDGKVDGYDVLIADVEGFGFDEIQFFGNNFDTKTDGLMSPLRIRLRVKWGTRIFWSPTTAPIPKLQN